MWKIFASVFLLSAGGFFEVFSVESIIRKDIIKHQSSDASLLNMIVGNNPKELLFSCKGNTVSFTKFDFR